MAFVKIRCTVYVLENVYQETDIWSNEWIFFRCPSHLRQSSSQIPLPKIRSILTSFLCLTFFDTHTHTHTHTFPCCAVASPSLCSHWALSWLNLSSSSSFSRPQFLSPIWSWLVRRWVTTGRREEDENIRGRGWMHGTLDSTHKLNNWLKQNESWFISLWGNLPTRFALSVSPSDLPV